MRRCLRKNKMNPVRVKGAQKSETRNKNAHKRALKGKREEKLAHFPMKKSKDLLKDWKNLETIIKRSTLFFQIEQLMQCLHLQLLLKKANRSFNRLTKYHLENVKIVSKLPIQAIKVKNSKKILFFQSTKNHQKTFKQNNNDFGEFQSFNFTTH